MEVEKGRVKIIEFGPRPTDAHNSSFSPPAGIMIIMIMTGAETR